MSYKQIMYSDKYYDDNFEYRHVILPKEIARKVPKNKNLSEPEWRNLGICMSRGWVHYGGHNPEPNILLFKRKFSGENPRQEMLKKVEEFEKSRKKVSLSKTEFDEEKFNNE